MGGVPVDCIFCSYLEKGSLITENEGAFAIYDNFPVTKGHALIIPKRHFSGYFDATSEEVISLDRLLREVKKVIDEKYHPDGYNIGINVGKAAGQTIFHLHIHLIPRYAGDVENPRGGIRKLMKPLVEYDG
ncbi:HIT family protein [Youngiibacter multivorans]|uniref:HIT family protein n=1 Tax=Youngiibacter multivorans TaxID=937251 RepID=UPI001AE49BF8|nr:HIT family protein [Youngiibacter multivorans]